MKKKVTLYAHWTKVLTSEEKKLVGIWSSHWDGKAMYQFYKDGTYISVSNYPQYDWGFKGYYSLKNGVLSTEYQNAKDYGAGFIWTGKWEKGSPRKIEFGKDEYGEYIIMHTNFGGMRYDKKT